jgi:hypothetical protein
MSAGAPAPAEAASSAPDPCGSGCTIFTSRAFLQTLMLSRQAGRHLEALPVART